MKSSSILCAALAATMGLGTAAQARDWNQDGNRHSRGEARQYQRHDRTDQRDGSHQQRSYAQPQYRAQQHYTPQNYAPRYSQQYRSYNYAPQYRSYDYAPQYRAYAHTPRYYAGGYVPSQYRAQRYWVNDWRARSLYAPPYGYQWVQTDTGDVLLMALATGLIASAILSQ